MERSTRASCGREKGHTDRARKQMQMRPELLQTQMSSLKTAAQQRPDIGDEPAAVIGAAEQQPADNQQREDGVDRVAQRRNQGGAERVEQHQRVPQLQRQQASASDTEKDAAERMSNSSTR